MIKDDQLEEMEFDNIQSDNNTKGLPKTATPLNQESNNGAFLTHDTDHSMVYTRLMCNYFSIGIESRIGLGFDKHRTGSALANKMWYTWEGLKKMCCCSTTKKIREIVDRVTCVEEKGGREEVIFTTDA